MVVGVGGAALGAPSGFTRSAAVSSYEALRFGIASIWVGADQ